MSHNYTQYHCLPNVTKNNFCALIKQMILSLGYEHVLILDERCSSTKLKVHSTCNVPENLCSSARLKVHSTCNVPENLCSSARLKVHSTFNVHVYWPHSDEHIYNITFTLVENHLSDTIMLELVQGKDRNYNVLRLIRFHLQQNNIISNDIPQLIISHAHKTLEHTAEQLVSIFNVAIRPNDLGMEYSMFPMFLIYIKHSINHMTFLKAKPDAILILFNIIKGAIKENISRNESYYVKVFSDTHSRCATTVLKYFVQSENPDVIIYIKNHITPENIMLLEEITLIKPYIIPSIAMHAKDILSVIIQ
jgi:hypothetical protein